MTQPPPVPTTAIYSRTDGVVTWRCARERSQGPITQNIEVRGSHFGLGHNPLVLYIIANRLAQPEDNWQPLDKSRLPKWLYPDPNRDSRADTSWSDRITSLDQALDRLNKII
jgi:hypothetical protein